MRLIILFFLTAISQIGFCQDLPENSSDSENGLVYFIRGKGFAGSATAFNALIDGQRVCKLNNRRYSFHEVSPGEHGFKAQFQGKSGKKNAEVVTIEIEAGKTYYIQMVMQMTFLVNDLVPQEITRNSALRLVKDDNILLDPNCKDLEE